MRSEKERSQRSSVQTTTTAGRRISGGRTGGVQNNQAAATDPHIHYVSGDGKLASLGEAQFDATSGVGVHPSNIAHLRIGQFVAGQIRRLPDWERGKAETLTG